MFPDYFTYFLREIYMYLRSEIDHFSKESWLVKVYWGGGLTSVRRKEEEELGRETIRPPSDKIYQLTTVFTAGQPILS